MKRRANGTIAKATEYTMSEYDDLLRSRLAEKSKFTEAGCLVWTGSTSRGGYGQIRLRNPRNKLMLAHRLAWALAGNSIPSGNELCHACDNRKCINIDHLFVGTRRDNMVDMIMKGRQADPSGERSGMSKLTAQQVVEICRRCANGELQKHVANDFGVHPAHVSRLVNQKRWPQRARAIAVAEESK